MLELTRCVLLCMLKVVEGELCLLERLEAPEAMRCMLFCMLEVPELMRFVLLCMLEAVEGELCLLKVLEVSEMPEVMRCVLLCMLEVVEEPDVPEVMRCMLLCMLEAVEGAHQVSGMKYKRRSKVRSQTGGRVRQKHCRTPLTLAGPTLGVAQPFRGSGRLEKRSRPIISIP